MPRRIAPIALILGLTSCSVINQVMAPPANTLLTVATYNIRHGQGMDNTINLERTAAVLRQHEPDIIALQEVDNRVNRSQRVDQARELGRITGMDHAFAAFMDHDGGRYGMAILSRHPIRRSLPIQLPDGAEPRVALTAEIELPNRERILVVNVHFDWIDSDGDRYRQASALTQVLDTLSIPYILLGDFNDTPNSRTVRLFVDRATELQKPSGNRNTFSSTDPTKEIDYIFVAPAGAWRVERTDVIAETRASDHRPVVGVVEHRKR